MPLYNNLFNLIPLPAWMYHEESLHILDVNECAIVQYGYSKEAFLGLNFKDLHPKEEIPLLVTAHANFIREEGSMPYGTFTHIKKNGESIRIKINAQKVVFKEQNSVLVVCEEITKEENQLNLAEARLSSATSIAKLGYWRREIATGKISWTDEIYKIWGRNKNDFEVNYDAILASIHPTDLERFEKAQQRSLEFDEALDIDHRILLPNGSIKWVHEQGRIVKDKEGNAIFFEGTMQDISSKKTEEERLKLLESVITNTNDAVLVTEAEPFDEPGPRILYVNKAFTKMTGYTSAEVIGKTPRILQGPNSDKEELKRLSKSLRKWESCHISTINYKKNGEEFWIDFTVTPVADERGRYTHWIAIERDITAQKEIEFEKELLSKISMDFSVDSDLFTAANRICKTVYEFGKFDLVEIWNVNLERSQIQLSFYHICERINDMLYESSSNESFLPTEGLPGKVWTNKAQVLLNNLDTNDVLIRKDAAKRNSLKAVLGIPLLHNNEVLSVMLIGSTLGQNHLKKYANIFKQLEGFIGTEIYRKKLENDLNRLYEAIPDIICTMDFKGRFLKMNKAGCLLLNYSEKEIMYRPANEFVHLEDQLLTSTAISTLSKSPNTFKFENRSLNRSGELIWLSWTCSSSLEEGLIYATAKNITQEKELRELNRLANKLARIGSWEIDLVKEEIYWSDMVHELHETDPNSFVPNLETAIHFYKEEFRSSVQSAINHSMETGESFDFEAIIVTATNKERWMRAIGNSEMENGVCKRIYGSFQDIHERKKAAEELNASYKEKNTILESIGDAFFSVTKDWVVTYWNKKAENILGKRREDVIGQNLWEAYPDAVNTDFELHYLTAMETQKNIRFEAYYASLNIWFEVAAYPSSAGLSVYLKDVTLRKQADLKLVEANERFEKVTEATNDTIWDWDLVNKTFYRSNGFEKFFLTNSSKSKKKGDFWKDAFNREDLPKIVASIEKAIEDPECHRWEMEYVIFNEQQEKVIVIDRGMILRDKKGKATRIVGAMTDITEQKNHENQLISLNDSIKKYAHELELSNEELEQFAFIASHDLQEPLRMISSFLDQLKRKYGHQLDDKANQYIHFATDGAKRMKQLILDLLEYSRAGRLMNTAEDVDLNEVLNQYQLLRSKIIEERNVEIVVGTLPTLHSFNAPLTQTIHSLLDNAIKYCPEDRAPKIEVTAKSLDDHWLFQVKDNGIGIDPNFFEKIFIMFQRLHNRDQFAGNGIGLSVAKKHVESWGGKIWLESEPNKGSVFYFTHPKHLD